jgi:lipopolysaccharide export system protein LptA
MHNVLPILLVLLAIFTASCIAYIAWELSSDKPVAPESADGEKDDDENLS